MSFSLISARLRNVVNKMSEYKNKTEKEIDKLLNEKREALRNFRFAISGSKTRNLREGRNTRREVARLMTELSDRRRL